MPLADTWILVHMHTHANTHTRLPSKLGNKQRKMIKRIQKIKDPQRRNPEGIPKMAVKKSPQLAALWRLDKQFRTRKTQNSWRNSAKRKLELMDALICTFCHLHSYSSIRMLRVKFVFNQQKAKQIENKVIAISEGNKLEKEKVIIEYSVATAINIQIIL